MWVSGKEAEVFVEIIERLGHFDTIHEVNAEIERLWGPIERCEIEGSIPWFKIFHCQSKNKGFDLCLVTLPISTQCEGV